MRSFSLNLIKFSTAFWQYLLSSVSYFLIALIKVYKLTISPLIGASCRYHPTCSAYAEQALKLHGPLRGGWLAVKRIFSCHPWGSWGYDPVPPKKGE